MNLNQLTPEQKAALLLELQAEQKQLEENKKSELKVYQHLKDETVRKVFEKLTNLSSELETRKAEVFAEFKAVLELKGNVYGNKEEQFSHTFTTDDGDKSIIIGHNTIDRWDETISVGIERVNQWLTKLAKDDASALLVGMVRDLLKPNKEGVLKANRVLDLTRKADELGDPELIEAVKIIRDSHRPDRTSTYVKAMFKNSKGERQFLGLSMSSV